MLGQFFHRELTIVPINLGIGRYNIPINVGVSAQRAKVPWFIRIGKHNIPSDVGVGAEPTKVPWLIRVSNHDIPSDVRVFTDGFKVPNFLWTLLYVPSSAFLFWRAPTQN